MHGTRLPLSHIFEPPGENHNSPHSPEVWLNNLVTSKTVQQGGVIRRKARDVERFAGIDRFMAEIDRRSYQVAVNAGQFVIRLAIAP